MDGINKNNFVCAEALLESGQVVLMGKQKYGFLVARHGWNGLLTPARNLEPLL